MKSVGRLLVIAAMFVCGGGCAVHEIGVSNPLPQVRRVAIAPFVNLSTQPDVDYSREKLFAGGYSDRRFAQAYYAELQKVPGFEVIPVGVVDQAIYGLKLPMEGPQDYLAVCEAVGADAICVGAVTDFDPYQPRLGMQVQWYALADVRPPAPAMPYEREHAAAAYKKPHAAPRWWQFWREDDCPPGGPHGGPPCVRGQSVELAPAPPLRAGNFPPGPAYVPPLDPRLDTGRVRGVGPIRDFDPTREEIILTDPRGGSGPFLEPQVLDRPEVYPFEPQPDTPAPAGTEERPSPPRDPLSRSEGEVPPLYSYTRLFDGRDARLTARLRDYVELSGDLRAGGWEGYLTRSDDFIRFCSNVMIVEMLQLHGGESLRRTVYKIREER